MSSQTLGQLECRSYVYVIECQSCDGTEHDYWYAGVSSPAHLGTRLDQHWCQRAARWTRTHRPVRVATPCCGRQKCTVRGLRGELAPASPSRPGAPRRRRTDDRVALSRGHGAGLSNSAPLSSWRCWRVPTPLMLIPRPPSAAVALTGSPGCGINVYKEWKGGAPRSAGLWGSAATA